MNDKQQPSGYDEMYREFGDRIEMYRPPPGPIPAPKAIIRAICRDVFGPNVPFRWRWVTRISQDWYPGEFEGTKQSTINSRFSELLGKDAAGKYEAVPWLDDLEEDFGAGWAMYVNVPQPMDAAVQSGTEVPYKPQTTRRRKGVSFHAKTPQIPIEIRQRIYEAQRGRCAGCGGRYRDVRCLQIDHVEALGNNGKNEPLNWQLLCPTCNQRKGKRLTTLQLIEANCRDIWLGRPFCVDRNEAWLSACAARQLGILWDFDGGTTP